MNENQISLKRSLFTVALAASALLCAAAHADEARVAAVRAGTIHLGDGTRIENGVILINEAGRISAVGSDLTVPQDGRVIDIPNCSVTPGLIDANARLEPTDIISQPQTRRRGVLGFMFDDPMHPHTVGDACLLCNGQSFMACALADLHGDLEPGEVCPVCGGQSQADVADNFATGVALRDATTEAASEVVPHTLVIDSINFSSPDFDRLLREGVTTVFASPDSSAVIGPRGAVVRTGGPLSERIVRDADAVQVTMGLDSFATGARNTTPSRFRGVSQRTRRPNSRMGVAWVLRKAFYDAEQVANGRAAAGAAEATPEALAAVQQIRAGAIPLRVQARTQRDILTAMRLAEEFDLDFTLLEGTESHLCLEEIASRDASVVYGPIYMGDESTISTRDFEVEENRLTTLRALLDAGVETCLSAQEFREENGLARQAMYAMRGGLTLDEAVQCVTLHPARMLGIDEEVGSIEPGKRADLVIWNGDAFSATARPVTVIVGGQVEYESR